MSDKQYAIWVSVSGGVTGTRGAFLKGIGGATVKFTDIGEATLIAEAYIKEMNGPHATARFDAKVVELSHE